MGGAAANSSIWIVLLPVIVGGLIAILNGFLGPFLIQRVKDVADKKRKRVEKFEELVAAVYEFDHWLEKREGEGLGEVSQVIPGERFPQGEHRRRYLLYSL
jgi:hypothetical protein